MADPLDNIVKVTVTRQTAAPATASFSEHLTAAEFDPAGITPVFDADHRVRMFSGMDEVAEAGFDTNSFVYRAALKQFSQSPHIGTLYVGLKLPTENWQAALSAILASNNDWYALTVSTRSMTDQQEVAEWVQANEKLCIIATGDPNAVNAESGDIGDWAKTMNLDRTAVFFHPDTDTPDDPIPEAAYFGKMLSKHPGSATWALKSLQAVPDYRLTGGQAKTAFEKNISTYTSVAGIPITSDGRVASGEYIDVIHGLDWLKALIQNRVFTPMVQRDKIPFTDTGIQIIVSQLRSALDEGIRRELLAAYNISVPKVSAIPANFRGQRTLPDVNFTASLAGAIHRVVINGTVTL
jgi:hypothetical protein